MSRFARDEDALSCQRIERDLDLIVDEVWAADPHVKCLVLTGGFARGEGTILDGAPQNDYDLLALRGVGGSPRYGDLADRLTERLGIHVDLAPVWAGRLRAAPRSIFWYETRTSGRALWGDASLLGRIRIDRPEAIDPKEGLRLLANRAAGLLLCGPEGDARRLQACKALLAAMDARVLAAGNYAPTYAQRWDAFSRLAAREGPHGDLIAWAMTYKLTPAKARRIDADEAWSAAANAVTDAVPVALKHAGLEALEEYGRHDSWVERVHYWIHAGRVGARRWLMHPASRLRVETLRLLAARVGAPHDSRLQDMVPHADPVPALRLLRTATLQ